MTAEIRAPRRAGPKTRDAASAGEQVHREACGFEEETPDLYSQEGGFVDVHGGGGGEALREQASEAMLALQLS